MPSVSDKFLNAYRWELAMVQLGRTGTSIALSHDGRKDGVRIATIGGIVPLPGKDFRGKLDSQVVAWRLNSMRRSNPEVKFSELRAYLKTV